MIRRSSRGRARTSTWGTLAAVACAVLTAACGGEGPTRGDVELRLLFQVDSLQRPESVAWDSARGRYLITNIAGEPTAEDGNGFITAVSADGERVELRRFDSSTPGVRLDGPKGIATRGDRAYVADIHRVVGLDLAADTGLFSREIPGSQFLNDVAVGADGTVYVSDMRGDAVFAVEPDGSDHRRIEAAGSLRGPNGLAVDPATGELLVAGWEGVLLRLSPDGPVSLVGAPRGAEHLDGIQPDPRGGVLFTDHTGGTLQRLPPGRVGAGQVEPVLWLEDLPGPADFLLRDSVLALPELQADRVRFYRVTRPARENEGD